MMKGTLPLYFAIGLLATNGCISSRLVNDKAKSHMEFNVDTEQNKQVDGQPAYYALLPLTVAGDVATSPFQLVWYCFTESSGQVSVDGVPVPLPNVFASDK
jgi:hypothetical protein